jgi:PAT family acetyl-CoA transporter-like MFS transporter 1
MNFFGIVYIASTTLILIFKNEKNKSYEKYTNANSMSIGETYSLLWNILKLKPIGLLMILMLTANVIQGPNPQTGIP